jgi:hypothetical protein
VNFVLTLFYEICFVLVISITTVVSTLDGLLFPILASALLVLTFFYRYDRPRAMCVMFMGTFFVFGQRLTRAWGGSRSARSTCRWAGWMRTPTCSGARST